MIVITDKDDIVLQICLIAGVDPLPTNCNIYELYDIDEIPSLGSKFTLDSVPRNNSNTQIQKFNEFNPISSVG